MIALALLCGAAHADPAHHLASSDASRRAESEGRFGEAVASCLAALEAQPDGPRSGSCAARIQRLERRRDADGSFTGSSRLHRVRAGYRDADPDALRSEVRALYGLESLAPVVRAEVELWLASDALHRLERPAEALPYTTAAHDRLAQLDQEEALQRSVVQLHALVLARLGQLQRAEAVEQAIRLPTSAPRPTPVQQVATAQRQRDLAWACAGVLATATTLSLPPALAGLKIRPRPLPLGVIALGVPICGAGLLAEAWARGAGAAIPWLLLGSVGIHLLSAAALSALSAAPLLRGVARLVALSATLATGYLALYLTGTLGWVGW